MCRFVKFFGKKTGPCKSYLSPPFGNDLACSLALERGLANRKARLFNRFCEKMDEMWRIPSIFSQREPDKEEHLQVLIFHNIVVSVGIGITSTQYHAQ